MFCLFLTTHEDVDVVVDDVDDCDAFLDLKCGVSKTVKRRFVSTNVCRCHLPISTKGAHTKGWIGKEISCTTSV